MSKYGGNNRIDFGVHFNTDKSSLAEVQKAFQKLQDIKPANFKGSREELVQIKLQALKVENALTKAFNVKLGSLNVEKFKNELKGLNIDKIYTDLSRLGSQGQVAFSKMATSMMTTNLQLRETHSLINSMGTTMMNTVKWGIASSVMNNFTQSVSQAFQYVKSLDSALTDIRIVTGDSTDQMAKFADQANRAAQELGRSTMDYSKAALTFYQQGLSDEDVAARTEATLKAQNITGAGEEMADYLTAVWNGYKVANEEAELYVDKLAAVADSSASNMAQLATAMSKVASSANMLGVPVDSLNAQIATIVATTRNAPESVGNALKTIYARINDISTGAEDAEISLGNYSSKMAEVGFSVLDANGNLRDTGDVIEQIGGKWETLSREQQIYLARTMAGQRQYNNLLALFDNWGKYTDLLNISMEAQGTTMEKNSRYMDSLAAHMEQLGAAGERVKSAMIDSDSFKGLIDIGTELTNLFANLIESIGGGGNALLMLGGALTSVFSPVIGREINNLVTNMQAAKHNAEVLKADLQQTKLLGESLGYQQGTIKEIVDAKQSLGILYTTITQEERAAYNESLMNVAAAKEALIPIEKQVELAQKYEQAFTAVGVSVSDFNDKIIIAEGEVETLGDTIRNYSKGDISNLFGDITKNKDEINDYVISIQEKIEQLRSTLSKDGQTPLFAKDQFDSVIEKIEKFSPVADNAQNKLLEIRNAAQQLETTIANANTAHFSMQGNIVQQERLRAQLDLTIQKANELKEQFQQGAGVQNAVNLFGQLGRSIGSVMGLMSGLKNIWSFIKDPGAEKSFEKLGQSFMSLAITVPMLKKTYDSLKISTLGLSQATLQQSAIEEASMAVKIAKFELDEAQSTLDSVRTGKIVILNGELVTEAAAEEAVAVATRQAESAQNGLNAAMAANPIGAILIAVTGLITAFTVITKLYDHFTMSTQQAAQAIQNFNSKQKELNDHIKDFREKSTSLKDVANEYDQLARKAGAVFGDSTLDNLTETERQRYNQIKNLIGEYNSEAIAGYNARGEAILTNNNALKETIELLKQQQQLQIDNFYNSDDYKDYLEAKKTQYKEAKQEKISKENVHLDDSQISKAENAKAKAVGVLSKYKDESLTQADENYFTYKKQMDQLNEIFNDGIENLYNHYDELIELQNLIAKEAPAISQDFNKYLDQIIEVAKIPQSNEAEWKAANLKLEQLSKFSSNDILTALQATTNNAEYLQLAQQIGEQNVNNLIKNYVSGLTRAEDFNEPEAIQQIKSKLLQPLLNLDLKESDFSEMSKQIANALQKEDFTSMTAKAYDDKMQEIINAFYQSNEKFQKIAKENPDTAASLLKAWFGLDNNTTFNFDSDNIVDNLVNSSTKILEQAKSKVKVALKNENINLDGRSKHQLFKWLQNQDLGTLENINSILENATLEAEGLTSELERAKNVFNDTQGQSALKDAAKLLQKQASGETLDDTEKETLEGALTQIEKLVPQLNGAIKILQTEWLQGTELQKNALESLVNATFDVIDRQKQARLESAGIKIQNPSDANQYAANDQESRAAKELIINTENLQAALQRGILTLEDYRDKLGELGSKYENASEEVNHYASAIKAEEFAEKQLQEAKEGTNQKTIEAAQKQKANASAMRESAEGALLLATRAGELAEASGLEAEQIERTAQYLIENNILGKENTEILRNNIELQADAAEAYIRLNKGLDDIYTNLDKYNNLLKDISESGADAINIFEDDTFNDFKESVADLFDVSANDLSDNWIVQNMHDILDAANRADEEGLQKLKESAAEDIFVHLGIDDEQFNMSYQDFSAKMATLSEGQELSLDMQTFTQQLVTAMQIAGFSQAEIEQKLSGMNISVDLQPYRAGLNQALEDSVVAGQKIGDSLAEGIAFDAVGKTQDITNESEDVYTAPKITAGTPVTGVFRFPVPLSTGGLVPDYEQGSIQMEYPTFVADEDSHKAKKETTTTVPALEVVSAHKKFGGKISNFNQPSKRNSRKARSGGGGGGKKGGGGSSAKPSIAKTNTTKIDTKKKTQENDPYYKVNKSLDKQSTLLKKLQDQEKNLSGKDRLKNLEAQAENLKEQNELLEQRQRISDNIAAENSTANLRKRLQDAFGKNISFDSEGKIADLNQTERAAVDSYNKAAQQAQSTFESVQKQYNNWILHIWNANSKAWQEAHQSEKEQWDERIKNAETNAKDAISAAEEEYKKKTDLIKAYEKALQEDQKRYEQYMNNIRKIMQSTFEQRKIKIQFDLDSGELERDWQDFENKVIRRIKDSDIVGNAAAQFRELSSYIQSQELQSVSDEIKAISDDIARVNAGAWTQLMGISQTDYEMLKPEDQQLIRKEALGRLEQQLNDYVKTEQEALSTIQDLTDKITESYLDSIDAAKDALDEHIDQYERINDLIEHNVKLTELLYGDKGYDTLNKYYDLQKQNNMNTLQILKQQEEYWRSRMQNEVVGSEAWKKFKENLDDAVDAVNSKLEDMLDNLTTQFEKKLAAAVERVNNKLTGGLGTSYLDEQWDYLNNYDDYFLDTYNATTGIEDVTRAYQQALDDAAANPKQQQRLNKLMNDQLKILREKDHLTEYDLERAKSMLEVEKARMALEDARNNKTKMRLRRDSQGNYTYQYVADEEKLGDLQQALVDAQNDLYNQDKEHYKENLNTLYDTYKEYLEKMQELTEEYRQAQAEAEATGNDTWLKQVQARIDLAKEQYDKFYTGLLEDNEYNQTYVTQAFANGLNLDLSGLSSEEAWGVIQENVPWAASNIQNLANSISNLGGLLPATNSLLQDFSSAAAQYKADMNDILEAGGTSIQTIGQVIDEQGDPLDTNIIEANSQVIMGYLDEITQKALTDVNAMQDLTQKLDEYWQNLNNNIQTYINNTREAYNTLQELLDSSTKAEVLDYTVPQINTTSIEGLAQAKEQLSLENINGKDINTLYNNYLSYLQSTNGALEIPRSQAQYQQLAENQQQLQEQYDRFYTDLVQDMIQQVSSMSIDSQIDQMTTGTSQLLSNLIKNQSLLDQNVHIDANFPNVNNHTQIEEAFNNLVNMAAMRASGYRD